MPNHAWPIAMTPCGRAERREAERREAERLANRTPSEVARDEAMAAAREAQAAAERKVAEQAARDENARTLGAAELKAVLERVLGEGEGTLLHTMRITSSAKAHDRVRARCEQLLGCTPGILEQRKGVVTRLVDALVAEMGAGGRGSAAAGATSKAVRRLRLARQWMMGGEQHEPPAMLSPVSKREWNPLKQGFLRMQPTPR